MSRHLVKEEDSPKADVGSLILWDTATGAQRKVAEGVYDGGTAYWLPDGHHIFLTRIAYPASPDLMYYNRPLTDIYCLNLDDHVETKICRGSFPMVSPDGTEIGICDEQDQFKLYTIRGMVPVPIPEIPCFDSGWVPDALLDNDLILARARPTSDHRKYFSFPSLKVIDLKTGKFATIVKQLRPNAAFIPEWAATSKAN